MKGYTDKEPAGLIVEIIGSNNYAIRDGLSINNSINIIIDGLLEREKTVIRMRFGIGCGRARTLNAIGEYFGVSLERIRQMEAKALRKARHPSRMSKWLKSEKMDDWLAKHG